MFDWQGQFFSFECQDWIWTGIFMKFWTLDARKYFLTVVEQNVVLFNWTSTNNFQDPAVRRAAAATAPANRGIEDYNPFAEPSSQGATQVRGAANPPIYGGVGATQQPATLQPTSQEIPPPAYARSPQQTVPSSALGSTLSPSAEVFDSVLVHL